MQEEYIKEEKISEKSDDDKKKELMRSIIRTKKVLEQAHQNFEYAEGELIDYYSYNIKANQAKLDYLLKKAKSMGVIMDCSLKRKVNDEFEVS